MESFCFPTFLFVRVRVRGTRACGRDTLHDTERAGRGGADTGMLFRDDAAHTAGRRSADGAAVSGLCPHHDGVFLRGGEDRALLSLGVRGAGMHAASAAGTAAGARPQRRVARRAAGADGHICYRAHCKGEGGQSGIARKSKNRRRRTARFREAWTALELRTAVSGGKKRKEKNQINGWELIPS